MIGWRGGYWASSVGKLCTSYWKTDFYSKDDGQSLLGCKQENDMLR